MVGVIVLGPQSGTWCGTTHVTQKRSSHPRSSTLSLFIVKRKLAGPASVVKADHISASRAPLVAVRIHKLCVGVGRGVCVRARVGCGGVTGEQRKPCYSVAIVFTHTCLPWPAPPTQPPSLGLTFLWKAVKFVMTCVGKCAVGAGKTGVGRSAGVPAQGQRD